MARSTMALFLQGMFLAMAPVSSGLFSSRVPQFKGNALALRDDVVDFLHHDGYSPMMIAHSMLREPGAAG